MLFERAIKLFGRDIKLPERDFRLVDEIFNYCNNLIMLFEQDDKLCKQDILKAVRTTN